MMDGAHRLMLMLLLQFEVEVKVDGQVGLLFCVSFNFVSLQVCTVSTSELPFCTGIVFPKPNVYLVCGLLTTQFAIL